MQTFEAYLNYQILSFGLCLFFLLVFMFLFIKTRGELKNNNENNSRALEEYAAAKASLDNLEKDNQQLSEKLNSVNEQLLELNRLNSALEQQKAFYESQNEELKVEKDNLLDENKIFSTQISQMREEKAALNSLMESKEQIYEQAETNHRLSEEKLKEELKNISESIVKTGTDDLNKFSKESLNNVVTPLKEELDKFREFLALSQENEATRAGKITEGLEKMTSAQVALTKEADELSKALKSGGKSQGMWGELQLERVLDSCGLDKSVDYQREAAQESLFGDRYRPDVVLNLPEEHCIIIDAKCSLTAYTDYVNADDHDEAQCFLKAHIKSIKDHIAELDKKQYQNNKGLNSPDFVFMFVPVDGALSEALYADSSLYQYASQKGVYLVSPSSIIPALRVVSSLWMLSEQTERMRDLSKLALGVADKFRLVIEALDDINKANENMTKKLATLNDRMRFGKDKLMSRMERFKLNARHEFELTEGSTISIEEKTEQSDE